MTAGDLFEREVYEHLPSYDYAGRKSSETSCIAIKLDCGLIILRLVPKLPDVMSSAVLILLEKRL